MITQPKTIINLSNTAPVVAPQIQTVSIGEEVEYQLLASIPVANLRNFYIEDNLPAGIDCIEAPEVILDPTYFSPAGTFNVGNGGITCTDNQVRWNFGNQELIGAPDSTARLDFTVSFIARVENSVANNDGVSIINGNLQ